MLWRPLIARPLYLLALCPSQLTERLIEAANSLVYREEKLLEVAPSLARPPSSLARGPRLGPTRRYDEGRQWALDDLNEAEPTMSNKLFLVYILIM